MYLELEKDSRFDISVFFNSFSEELKTLLEEAMEENSAVKWHLLLKLDLEKISVEGEEVLMTYFHSETFVEFTIDNLEDHLSLSKNNPILSKIYSVWIRLGIKRNTAL